MTTATTVLWELLARSGIQPCARNSDPPEPETIPAYRLKRRLQFRTLLQDALDAEPWEREGFDPEEVAATERAEAMLSLHTYENKPHMLMMLPPGAIKRAANPVSWSDEVGSLRSELPKHQRTKMDLLGFFRTLRLDSRNIACINRGMMKMSSLKELSLRDNAIETVENLPPSVQVLSLCMNHIEVLGASDQDEDGMALLRRRRRASLQALAAAHNRIHDIRNIHVLFPGLLVLNLGFNSLTNVEDTKNALRPLPSLVVLTLLGNPLCLLRDYRIRMVGGLKGLTHLDGVEVEEWERNTKVSDKLLGLEQKILTLWSAQVAKKQRADFLQESHSPDQLYHYVELSASRKLQKYYRALKIRQTASLQRHLLRAERRGELVVLKVSIDWLKLLLPPEPPVAAAPVPTNGKATPAAGKKPDPKQKAVVEEPPVPELPKEAYCVRLVLPSEYKVGHTLPYMEKKALLEFNYERDFQLPVTPGLRDLFFFKGLRYQVWHKTNSQDETASEELDTPRDTVSSAADPRQSLVAKGIVPFRPFFDPATFKATSGSPVLTHEIPLKLAPTERRRRRLQPASSPTKATAAAAVMEATLRVRVQLNTEFNPHTSTTWL